MIRLDEEDFSAFAGIAGFTYPYVDEDQYDSASKRTHFSFASLNKCEHEWIIDSGASSHMTFNCNFFNKKHITNGRQVVVLPDGSVKHMKYTGEVKLSEEISLNNVLCLPHFKYNLLSVSSLLREGKIEVIFYANYCHL